MTPNDAGDAALELPLPTPESPSSSGPTQVHETTFSPFAALQQRASSWSPSTSTKLHPPSIYSKRPWYPSPPSSLSFSSNAGREGCRRDGGEEDLFTTARTTTRAAPTAACSSSSLTVPEAANIAQDSSSTSSFLVVPSSHASRPFSSPSLAAPSPSVSPLALPTNFAEETWPQAHDEEHLLDATWPDLTHSGEEHIRQHVEREQKLLVRVMTWNQAAQPPPPLAELQQRLLPPNRFHLYVLGSQECGQSIATSVVLSSSKAAWETALRKALGSNYEVLASHTMQAAHLIVLCHKALVPFLSNLRSAAVPCGLLENALGNKGGIGVAFRFLDTRFLIVSAHLAAGQRCIKLRHADYHRIVRGLLHSLGDEEMGGDDDDDDSERDSDRSDDYDEEEDDLDVAGAGCDHQASLLESFDHVVWCGDLNYRVDGSRDFVDLLLLKNMHRVLLANDQLSRARAAGEAFAGFAEGPLFFRPTYKLDKGADTYDSSHKARVPAWTDRILFKAEAGVHILAYFSVPELRDSDHRPVVATLHMPLISQSIEDQAAVEPMLPENASVHLSQDVEIKVYPRRRRLALCSIS